jgi:hypothetical protein
MRGIIAKLVSRAIFKKFGYEIDVQINEIEIKTEGGKIHLHTSVDAAISNDDFAKIIKSTGLD